MKWYFDIINDRLCARHQGHIRHAPTSRGFTQGVLTKVHALLGQGPQRRRSRAKSGRTGGIIHNFPGLFITSPERAGFTYATDQTTGGTPSSRQRGTGSRQQLVRQVLSHLKGWGRWPVTALSVLLPKRDSLSDLTTRADRQTAYVQDFIFGLKL